MSVTQMLLFSGIILTADGAADIVFLIMIRLGMRKSEKLPDEKEPEEKSVLSWNEPETADLNKEEQEKTSDEDKTEWEKDTNSQAQETEMEIETEKTADAADADTILDANVQTSDEDVESPGREIREMLKNNEEPLEEWKD